MKNLTKRELEVSQLIMEGYTNKQIAEKLFISTHTVKAVLENIYEKLDIHNRVLLALKTYKYTVYCLKNHESNN